MMTVSSRTPEGEPFHCRICGVITVTEPSPPFGDAACPQCGSLLLSLRDRLNLPTLRFDDRLSKLTDSLDVVELVMELEEEFDLEFSEAEIGDLNSVADLIRFLRHRNEDPDST